MSAKLKCRDRGFTLVELLVVIGIIALLISILLPSLSRARESAASVKCLSNLRQITMAFIAYTADSKGRAMSRPSPAFSGGGYIMYVLTENGYINLQNDPQVQFCPMAQETSQVPGSAYGVGGTVDTVQIGNATRAWRRNFFADLVSEGSYTYNGWIAYSQGANTSGDQIIAHPNQVARGSLFYGNVSRARNSTQLPFIGDGVWSEAFALEQTQALAVPQDPFWRARFLGASADTTEGQINRFYVARHNKGMNMAFMDGHAETITNLHLLWKMPHHSQWDLTRVPAAVQERW